ncbi:DUF456 domain-containing protein [Hazenella sp. IB182357]|uniref:DUF456 domain-containing protein n=1 Tax=Polycladospora coralii TaxID=2771432 RepID=A0A926RTK2_9BACL|nr:DUF456 domain-containing protein [Polycladospora coralii]MBS7531013.1 DUF456 domain-containing protein [Polycladospora coralii]
MEIIWWIIIGILFLLAYAGLVAPGLPDAPFILGGFLIYHFFINDTEFGWVFWISMTLITIMLIVIDYISGGVVAKKYGGSTWSMIAAAVGVIVFPFIMGPIGILIGPFVLVLLLELILRKSKEDALKIAFGTVVGFIGGTFVKFFILTAMIIWFGLALIF